MTKATHATWASALHGFSVHLNHAHAWLYSNSDGRLGASVGGHRVLLLTTRGRLSGRERRTPVQYERLGDEVVVVAAGGGSPSPLRRRRGGGFRWSSFRAENQNRHERHP